MRLWAPAPRRARRLLGGSPAVCGLVRLWFRASCCTQLTDPSSRHSPDFSGTPGWPTTERVTVFKRTSAPRGSSGVPSYWSRIRIASEEIGQLDAALVQSRLLGEDQQPARETLQLQIVGLEALLPPKARQSSKMRQHPMICQQHPLVDKLPHQARFGFRQASSFIALA